MPASSTHIVRRVALLHAPDCQFLPAFRRLSICFAALGVYYPERRLTTAFGLTLGAGRRFRRPRSITCFTRHFGRGAEFSMHICPFHIHLVISRVQGWQPTTLIICNLQLTLLRKSGNGDVPVLATISGSSSPLIILVGLSCTAGMKST